MSSLFLFESCSETCNKELEKCQKGCHETPPTEGTDFWLSLNIENASNPTGRYQTIFVESPLEDGIGNSFAIAGTITSESFDVTNNDYINVKIEKIGIRRLSGLGFKIDKVSTKVEKIKGEDVRFIDIVLSKSKLGTSKYDEHLKNIHLLIPKLNANQRFETRVSFSNIAEWRPRICELYVSTGSVN